MSTKMKANGNNRDEDGAMGIRYEPTGTSETNTLEEVKVEPIAIAMKWSSKLRMVWVFEKEMKQKTSEQLSK